MTTDVQILLREAIAAAKAAQATQPAGSKSASKIYRIGAAQANQKGKARQLLLQVIEQDETLIPAWLWLSTVTDDPDEKRTCLENVLILEPDNKYALAGLDYLRRQVAASPPAVAKSRPDRRAEATATGVISPTPAQAASVAKPASSASAPTTFCPFCRAAISPVDTTCPHCQAFLIVDCPACEARTDVEQRACGQCGYVLGDFQQGADYFVHLAQAYRRHNRPDKALRAWQVLETLQPDYPSLYLNLGRLQGVAGRTDAAISYLQQAMQQESSRIAATLALGEIFQQLRRWDEAQMLFQKALKLAPDQAEPHFTMGWLLMEQGQLQAAFPHLQKAVRLNPSHGPAWLRLAQLHDRFGHRRQAAQAYRQATALLPGSSLANLEARQRLHTLQPTMPLRHRSGSGEFMRQLTGPALTITIAVLMDAGLRPWWIPWDGWLALLLGLVGTFLWVGGSMPQNPLITQLLSGPALESKETQLTLIIAGLTCWALALILIALPINQSLPVVPAL